MRFLGRFIAVLLTAAMLTTTAAFADTEVTAGKTSAPADTKVTEAAETSTDADVADVDATANHRHADGRPDVPADAADESL